MQRLAGSIASTGTPYNFQEARLLRGDELLLLLPLLMGHARTEKAIDPLSWTMSTLERLATSDEDLARALMAALYPKADVQYAHEVCNGIDLWMEAPKSVILVSWLQDLAEAPAMSAYRVKIADWLHCT